MNKFSPTERDKGFFAGTVAALAVLEIYGSQSEAEEIARNAGADFMREMADWSGVEQDRRLIEKFC